MYHIFWIKDYFSILDNLLEIIVVLWFSENKSFNFCQSFLLSNLSSFKNNFKIKYSTTEIVLFNHLLADQTTHFSLGLIYDLNR
jgi:hypothetical protein